MGVPASVLAQYQSVNARADQTANLPFNQYSQQASSVAPDYTLGNAGTFVAPVNQQQQQGIQGTNTAANQAQPYYTAATGALGNAQAGTTGTNSAALGLAGQSAEQVNAQQIGANQINQFMSPYLQDVVGSEANVLNQQNQQQQAGQLGNAINSGAFGGDRTGIAAANLEQQQNLANSQIYSGLLNQGFNTALGAAQQQQGVNLQAGQANRAALGAAGQEMAGIGQTQYGEGANTASALAGLGSGAQAAGLQGAQAQMGAGTLEQQTQQAQDTAQYNQFLQQQSYPFQVDQFLANIAEGTGALSGSTTTTQQPGGFFSDERLKHDKRAVGKTFDGQTIYSYKMHGDPRTHMGLMAQEVEKKHPEAVGLAAGYKTVDYGKATGKAANQGHFRDGGVVPMRAARAAGGGTDLDAILAAQQQMYSGLGGGGPRATTGAPHGGMARVPSATMPVGNLITAQGGLRAQPTGAQNVAAMGQFYKDIGSPKYSGSLPWGSTTTTTTPGGLAPNAMPDNPQGISQYSLLPNAQSSNNVDQNQADTPIQGLAPTDQKRGGRIHRALGGDMPYSEASGLDIPDENPHNQLSKPAALPPPSPTGFQQLMSMGSGMGGAGGMMGQMGGMFGGSGGSSGLFDGGSTAGDAYGAAAASSDATIAGDLAAAGARGGRMKRDSGGAFDADSAPNSGSLGDAPDTSVAQSPALKQGAPNTSLDSVKHLALAAGEAYIGDYPGAAGQLYQTYQSTQTNNKRGGRIGKDGGGGLSGDPDITPTNTPADYSIDTPLQADVPTAKFAGLAPEQVGYTGNVGLAPTPAASVSTPDMPDIAPAPEKKDSGTPLWDTIKTELSKPSNIIPIIAGLGAMGTAPTRSLGTALAAGLSGAAQSYYPAQIGAQQVQLMQTQNSISQMRQQATQGYLDQQGAPKAQIPIYKPLTDADFSGATTASDYDNIYRTKYAVPPITPTEQKYFDAASGAANLLGPNPVNQAKQDIAYRQQAQTFASQQAAQHEAQALYPSAAAGDPAALARYNALFQWTGDRYTDMAGAKINSRTGAPAIGVAAQSLTPEQQITSALAQRGQDISNASIEKDENGTPWRIYRAPGLPTLRLPAYGGAGGSMSNGPAPAGASPAGATPALGGPGVATPKNASTSSIPASTVPMLPGVDMNKFPKVPTSSGFATKTGNVAPMKLEDLRAQEKENANDAVKLDATTGSILTQAQKEIAALEKNPMAVGPGSNAYNTYQKFKAGVSAAVGGGAPDQLVNQEELDKFLSQVGAQNVRKLLQGQKITNQEMMTFMTRGSPNVQQPLPVIKNLVGYLAADNEYDQRLQNTKLAALKDPTIDPSQVASTLESLPGASRGEYVQSKLGWAPTFASKGAPAPTASVRTATGPNGQKLYLRGGQWVDK